MPRLCRLPRARPFHAPGPSARLLHQMPGQRCRPVTAPTSSTWLSNRSGGTPSTCGHPLLTLLSTARRVARCSEIARRPDRTFAALARAGAVVCLQPSQMSRWCIAQAEILVHSLTGANNASPATRSQEGPDFHSDVALSRTRFFATFPYPVDFSRIFRIR